MADILFEVTEDKLETGLRGYPVGYCSTSKVDPELGLFYHERPLKEIYHFEPEQVIHYLKHGIIDEGPELDAFKKQLHDRAACDPRVIEHINHLPKEGHPMELFTCAIQILGMFEGKEDYREDCMNLIAKLPHLVAAVINHHAGWGETPAPTPEEGYMASFSNMLQAPEKSPQLAEVLKLFNILHYDHGGGNLSCFVGKAVASGLEDMYGSITSAMCALAGPRHGKANQDCLEFVKKLCGKLGDNPTPEAVQQEIRDMIANKELIFGFGHAVLRVEDPRATFFYEYGQEHFPDHPLIKMILHLREQGPIVLKENPKIADPYPNVDAASGSILTAAGLPHPEYYTLLFGLSRAVGIAIQIVYERCEAREGKGLPIVRPKYIYRAK